MQKLVYVFGKRDPHPFPKTHRHPLRTVRVCEGESYKYDGNMSSFSTTKYCAAVLAWEFYYGSVPWLDSEVKTKRYYFPTENFTVGKIKLEPEKILRFVEDRLRFFLFTCKKILKLWKSANILTYAYQLQTTNMSALNMEKASVKLIDFQEQSYERIRARCCRRVCAKKFSKTFFH